MKIRLKESREIEISERDIWLIQLVAEGERYKDIAKNNRMTTRQVQTALEVIRNKTNSRTLAQVVALFLRNKIME